MGDQDWETLLSRIANQKCTPFLGAGASAHILPTGGALADEWANQLTYPFPNRDDLAQVAQYMAIVRSDPLVPKERIAEVCSTVNLAQALQDGDPYDVISGLDLPVYITTNYDDLLLQALRNRRKEPRPMLCPWNDLSYELAGEDDLYRHEPDERTPAVYFLHGNAQEPGSIVLTEDDYLDFIVWITRQWREQAAISRIAPCVKQAMAKTSLLFIGYSQNDWTFRVLMRSIRETGANLRALNIAVQLSPLGEDAAEEDQEKVTDYLTSYFSNLQDNSVKLYWGTAREFCQELQERREASST